MDPILKYAVCKAEKRNWNLEGITSKTSSSRILVPNTVIPLVLMAAWSLLPSGFENFFLQSTIMVTVFLWTLMATRCHLGRKGGNETCPLLKSIVCEPSPLSSLQPAAIVKCYIVAHGIQLHYNLPTGFSFSNLFILD